MRLCVGARTELTSSIRATSAGGRRDAVRIESHVRQNSTAFTKSDKQLPLDIPVMSSFKLVVVRSVCKIGVEAVTVEVFPYPRLTNGSLPIDA